MPLPISQDYRENDCILQPLNVPTCKYLTCSSTSAPFGISILCLSPARPRILFLNIFIVPISCIIKISLSSGSFPSADKHAVVSLIINVHNIPCQIPLKCSYTALLPITVKYHQRIVHIPYLLLLFSHDPPQSGFHPQHSI